METRVDILIPSKNRALQLHLLFESMASCLKNIGKITVSYQGSTDVYIQAYQLLEERIRNDVVFEQLRANSTEIIFQQRDSLSGVIKVIDNLGDSDYVMQLVDDEIFYRDYNLGKAKASEYFFNNESVLACSLRLGDNILFKLQQPGKEDTACDITHVFKKKDKGIMLWSWPETLNITHWNCLFSTTGHIYRKKMFLDWFRRFGKKNFLCIESSVNEDLVFRVYGIPKLIVNGVNLLSRCQMGFFRRVAKVKNYKNIKQVFGEWVFRTKIPLSDVVPTMIAAVGNSVCYNLDLNNSLNRNLNLMDLEGLNQKYLNGYVLNYSHFSNIKVDFPIMLYSMDTSREEFVRYK